MRKVRVTLPKAQSGLNVRMDQADAGPSPAFPRREMVGREMPTEVNTTLKPVPRDQANVEAEKGETVVTNMQNDGIPEHYKVGGKNHSAGGTPLNLPNNSFVFSKDRKLAIDDAEILALFGKKVGKKGKKKFVPADLAKQYNINKYRKILADPTSDEIMIDTAEKMIENYNLKLGGLSMVQESMKGFDNGIPAIAMPYLEKAGIDPSELFKAQGMNASPETPMMKYGGQTKRKVRINLPLMQAGGATGGGNPSTTGRSTKVQNIPQDAIKWDETSDGYDEKQIQVGDYIKKSDGRWYKVQGYKAAPYEYNFEDSRLTGEGGDLQEPYGRLEQMIMDPNNEDLRNEIIKKHRTNLSTTKPNPKTGLTQADIDRAADMTPEEIIGTFLEMQKQVFSVNASGIGGKGMDESDSWDADRTNYTNTVTNLGFEPLDPWQQAGFQSTYIALNDLSKDPKYKDVLSDFRMAQEGRDDENVSGLREGSISQIDGWVGNTTIGQGAIYKPTLKELDIQEADWEDVTPDPQVPALNVSPQERENAPFWLQDIIKTAGAATDMARIKKHTPWQATPGTYLPDPTFYDPTRELAAIGEQAGMAQQAAAAFAGPQALGARSSAIQGQAARNIADTLGRYNDMNVGAANQFELARTQIMNQAAREKAGLATQLYDKNVIANQQFDNAKNMAREQLRTSYIDAITNRAQTQAMNELYPQYNVDPTTGGFLQFDKGRPLDPTISNTPSVMDKFQEYKSQNPGVDDRVLFKMASTDMGMPQNPANQIDPAYFGNYQNMIPG